MSSFFGDEDEELERLSDLSGDEFNDGGIIDDEGSQDDIEEDKEGVEEEEEEEEEEEDEEEEEEEEHVGHQEQQQPKPRYTFEDDEYLLALAEPEPAALTSKGGTISKASSGAQLSLDEVSFSRDIHFINRPGAAIPTRPTAGAKQLFAVEINTNEPRRNRPRRARQGQGQGLPGEEGGTEEKYSDRRRRGEVVSSLAASGGGGGGALWEDGEAKSKRGQRRGGKNKTEKKKAAVGDLQIMKCAPKPHIEPVVPEPVIKLRAEAREFVPSFLPKQAP